MASILLVDDDPHNLEITSEILSSKGHQIYATPNGLEAMEQVRQKVFDLSILDVHMPEIGGFELLEEILHIYPITCIFITADKSKELRLKALDLGAFAILYKPLNPSLLHHTINKAISSGNK